MIFNTPLLSFLGRRNPYELGRTFRAYQIAKVATNAKFFINFCDFISNGYRSATPSFTGLDT